MSIYNSTNITGKITARIVDYGFLELRSYRDGGGFDGHNIKLPDTPTDNLRIAAAAINGDWDAVRKMLPEPVKADAA